MNSNEELTSGRVAEPTMRFPSHSSTSRSWNIRDSEPAVDPMTSSPDKWSSLPDHAPSIKGLTVIRTIRTGCGQVDSFSLTSVPK